MVKEQAGWLSNDAILKKGFQSYLLPSVLAILGGNFSIMIDNVIAGIAMGEKALASMALVNPVFTLMTMAGVLISGGSSTLASVKLGEGKKEERDVLFTWAFLLTMLCGGIAAVLGLCGLNWLLPVMGAKGGLFPYVYDYCQTMLTGGICIMAIYLPLNYFRIDGRGRIGSRMFLIMGVLDVLLDCLFVFGLKMEMRGLALATVLSALAAVASCAPALFRGESGIRLVSVRKKKECVRSILVTGSPLALGHVYRIFYLFFLNRVLLVTGGSLAVACYSFATSINTIPEAVISGVAQTVGALTGVLYGEKDMASIRRVVKIAVKTGTVLIGVFLLLIVLISGPLAGLYGFGEGAAMQMARAALILLGLQLMGALHNHILIYYFMTVGRTVLANQITLFRGILFPVPVIGLMAALFGATGIWCSFLPAELCAFVGSLALIARIRKRDPHLKGLLLLNMEQYQKGRVLAFSVENDTAEIARCAKQVTDFCEQCMMKPKQTMLLSLAIEEILILMKEHIWDEGRHFMEVRIFAGEEDVILRIRCGGKAFNPLSFYEKELAGEDMDFDESLGLQMISRAARKIDYSTNLGMNNIVITI